MSTLSASGISFFNDDCDAAKLCYKRPPVNKRRATFTHHIARCRLIAEDRKLREL
jgi:hypothetical protein